MFHSFLLILCLTIPVYLLFLFQYRKTIKKLLLPPGPRGLPIIGNLHQLDNSALYQHLWQLSKKYGLDLAFSPYNNYWKEIRKTCVIHVLSSRRVSCFYSIRHFEVKQMIKKKSRHTSSSKVTNLNELLMSLANTIICRIALGRRYEEEGTETSRFLELFKDCQP